MTTTSTCSTIAVELDPDDARAVAELLSRELAAHHNRAEDYALWLRANITVDRETTALRRDESLAAASATRRRRAAFLCALRAAGVEVGG